MTWTLQKENVIKDIYTEKSLSGLFSIKDLKTSFIRAQPCPLFYILFVDTLPS